MRITPFTIFSHLNQALDNTMQDYSKLNDILASNKAIQAPSDNVNGMARALDYKLSISNNNQYSQNIDTATTSLKFTNTVLTSVDDTLLKINDLVTAHLSSVTDTTKIALDSQTATTLRDMLLNLANTKLMNQYVFSGFKSDTPPYQDPALVYQGDAGKINIPVNKGTSVQTNVTGDDAFSYTIGALGATYTKQISGGLNVHYTQGAGTTIDVEIHDANDNPIYSLDAGGNPVLDASGNPVLDPNYNFSFSNVMQMTDLLSSAITANNTNLIQALADPFSKYQTQLQTTQASIGSRLDGLDGQSTMLSNITNSLQDSLSSVEDADTIKVIAMIKQTEVTLQAIRDSASRVLQQSLFDFLK
jgi:flagellar hook-associated protein 3 FlgL